MQAHRLELSDEDSEEDMDEDVNKDDDMEQDDTAADIASPAAEPEDDDEVRTDLTLSCLHSALRWLDRPCCLMSRGELTSESSASEVVHSMNRRSGSLPLSCMVTAVAGECSLNAIWISCAGPEG